MRFTRLCPVLSIFGFKINPYFLQPIGWVSCIISIMSNKTLLPALILAGTTLLHAQAMVEYGASAGRAAGSAAAAGAGKSASKIFDKLNTSLAGAGKVDQDVKKGSAPAPVTVAAVTAAPAPAAPPAAPLDFAALVKGMDRADLFTKVGKPSMMMSSMESSRVIETCWYKNGAESIRVIIRDGKVAEISGLEK